MAHPSEWKRPTTAAANAGTMNSVYVPGTSGTRGAMRMPAMPHTTKLMIQLTSAMRSGESPLTSAPISVSAEARVANPNRVNRKRTVSTMPMPMIVAARSNRSTEMSTPRKLTWFCGKIGLTRTTAVPA